MPLWTLRPVKISVVIPAFNEEKLLGETLRQVRAAMAAFTDLGWASELIVCDNNSTDHTAEIARQAGARVVFEPVNQISRARNTGAAAATGDWLLFIDADSRPSRELLVEAAAAIQSGRCLAGGSTVCLEGPYRIARWGACLWNGLSRGLHWLAGSFIFCEAAVFRQLGGFSQELFVSEEIDLSRRLKPLARRRRKRIVILHRHPLVTSARKLHLYSTREYLWFLARVLLSNRRALKDPRICHPWYDGRR
jgi:glycosyltransferase involved in cell wall biosynthesis